MLNKLRLGPMNEYQSKAELPLLIKKECSVHQFIAFVKEFENL